MRYQWLLHSENSRDVVAFEHRMVLDSSAMTGSIDHYPLSEGLDAFAVDLRTHEPTRLTTSDERSNDVLGGIVLLQGHCMQELPECSRPLELDPQHGAFFRPHVRRADYAFDGGTRMRALAYNIAPERILAAVDGAPPAALRGLLPDGDRPPSETVRSLPCSDALRRTAREALTHGYAQSLARLYVESRVLELLVRQTHVLAGSDDIDAAHDARRARIRDAAAMLEENLSSPPSLAGLAAAVGLPERQLQAGFREAYGTTVFTYLRNARLDAAHDALAREDIPLKVVAERVGYSNSSNFANAFRHRFGIAPGQVRVRAARVVNHGDGSVTA